MIIEGLKFKKLSIEHWELAENLSCTVLGNNASGKSFLAKIIAREISPECGLITNAPDTVNIVSLESQQKLYEEELENEDTDFLDRIDYGSTGRELLTKHAESASEVDELARRLKIEDLLNQHYRLYSSGEARKILLAREFLAKPDLLILDEPFEGLDPQGRSVLVSFCEEIKSHGQAIMLVVNRIDDVPLNSESLTILFDGRIIKKGPADELLAEGEIQSLFHFDASKNPKLPPAPLSDPLDGDELISLKRGSVRYGDTVQFSNLNWTLRKGEHTLICGPNGAGKSTLLQLVTGDHPQCYSNDLTIFGYRRGSGESIWDIKRHIGIISSSIHRDYRVAGNALTTVISGLYDSIGLYQTPTEADKQLALQWLEVLGLSHHATTYFQQLSWGQQRLILIARGLIKQPPLLILDEPTQGLDDLNRQLVLSFIERLAGLSQTTCLFVSHREDEHLSLFKHRIEFSKSDSSNVRFTARTLKHL